MATLETYLSLRENFTSKLERIQDGIARMIDSSSKMAASMTGHINQVQTAFEKMNPDAAFSSMAQNAAGVFNTANEAAQRMCESVEQFQKSPSFAMVNSEDINRVNVMAEQADSLGKKLYGQRQIVNDISNRFGEMANGISDMSRNAVSFDEETNSVNALVMHVMTLDGKLGSIRQTTADLSAQFGDMANGISGMVNNIAKLDMRPFSESVRDATNTLATANDTVQRMSGHVASLGDTWNDQKNAMAVMGSELENTVNRFSGIAGAVSNMDTSTVSAQVKETAETFGMLDGAVKRTSDAMATLSGYSDMRILGGDEVSKMDLMLERARLLEGRWAEQVKTTASLTDEYNRAQLKLREMTDEINRMGDLPNKELFGNIDGITAKIMQLDNALLNAAMQENNLAMQCVRAQEAIARQANGADAVHQAIVRQQAAEQRLAKLMAQRESAQIKVRTEMEKTYLTQLKQMTENNRIQKEINNKTLAEQRVSTETERTNLMLLKQQELAERISQRQETLNNKLKVGTNHAGGLWDKLKGIAAVYLSFRGLKAIFENTLGAAGALQQQKSVMHGMFGDLDVGSAYYEQMQQFAELTRHKITDLTDATRQFLPFTRNTDKLMGLTKIADRLAVMDPSRGITGAADAITQALNGSFSSLQRTYGLPNADLEKIQQAVKLGNIEGITAAFGSALDTAGITNEVANAFRNTAKQQFASIVSTATNRLAEASTMALERLQPALVLIGEWFQSEQADRFFAVVNAGLTMIVDGVLWITDAVRNNWGVIQPILAAAGIALALVAIVSATGAALSLAGWLLAAWPFVLLVAVITGVITRLKEMGVTTNEIVGFVGGVFGAVVGFVYNLFVGLYNLFISVAEFFANVFIDPAYAFKKLFYDVVMEVAKFFDNLIQGILSGINWVIDKINGFSGSNIQKIQWEFTSILSDSWQDLWGGGPTSDKAVVDYSGMKMEYADFSKAATWGSDKAIGLLNSLDNKLGDTPFDFSGWNASQLDNIKADTGAIANSVDVSSEQLKYLRDIAEQQAINEFTTRMVVPQLQITFGDIRETADIEQIKGRLTQMLEEELAVMAEGVHA